MPGGLIKGQIQPLGLPCLIPYIESGVLAVRLFGSLVNEYKSLWVPSFTEPPEHWHKNRVYGARPHNLALCAVNDFPVRKGTSGCKGLVLKVKVLNLEGSCFSGPEPLKGQEIEYVPVLLWYGRKDINLAVPVSPFWDFTLNCYGGEARHFHYTLKLQEGGKEILQGAHDILDVLQAP